MNTLKDIAKQCNVSVTTVSLALNHPHKISKSVRDKVYEAIQQTGYFKANNERILQIGIVFDNFKNYYFGDFYQEVTYGVFQKLSDIHCNIRILDSFDVDYSDIHDLHGLLFIGRPQNGYYEKARKFRIPFVNVGHPLKRYNDVPGVYYERTLHTTNLVEYLISCGHEHIGIFSGERDTDDIIDNEFRSTIAHFNPNHNDNLIFECNYHAIETVEIAWNKVLSHKPKVTALMCSNDLLAYQIYNCAEKYKIEIPKDISITGYDGLWAPRHLKLPQPRLTTVYTDRPTLGIKSVELLYAYIMNLPNKENLIKLTGQMVMGDSVLRI